MTAPAATQDAPTPTTEKKDTTVGNPYVILEESDDGYAVKSKAAKGRDAEHALRKWAELNGNQAGTFIAIPLKSWRRVTITPQTVTTLKLEEAK